MPAKEPGAVQGRDVLGKMRKCRFRLARKWAKYYTVKAQIQDKPDVDQVCNRIEGGYLAWHRLPKR